jgi:cyclopropane fatty-acyl-phospholipid synthase-like methyltransferase
LTEFWRKHYRQAVKAYPMSPLKQVGKTVNGSEVGEDVLTIIVNHVAEQLGLTNSDKLVDLGSGNGLLTVRLSKMVRKVIGADFVEDLLTYACRYNRSHNVVYVQSDILNICEDILDGATALTMYEVLQHLSLEDFYGLMMGFAGLKSGARFFIGGVPDKDKLRNFYDTDEKYEYFMKCESNNQPHLGRWWTKSEISEIAENSGWIMRYVAQPDILYTSYYRFDAVLVKA